MLDLEELLAFLYSAVCEKTDVPFLDKGELRWRTDFVNPMGRVIESFGDKLTPQVGAEVCLDGAYYEVLSVTDSVEMVAMPAPVPARARQPVRRCVVGYPGGL